MVVYFSRGGKTRKVAEAIARELGCEAVDLKKEIPDVLAVDVVVVGSGNYGGSPHKKVQEFIDSLQSNSNCKAAVFATSGGPDPQCISVMEEALKKKDYDVVSSFYCPGRFLFANRGRPNEEDLKNAKKFASELKNL